MSPTKRIVIFASGNGTNAQRIIEYFSSKPVEIALILTNKPSAKVLKRADNLNISAICFNRKSFYDTNQVLAILQEIKPNLIVLAGFLWLFPENILKAFPDKVINIHPALLPDFGGKGMYGDRVHQAVIASAKKESGITIHYVSREYDKGNIIFQAKTAIEEGETPETLAEKIHALEYEHFPIVIEKLLKER
ncbi:phosphoribosylglycinamide formyltransferase [Flavimarina sp. Hel_I_48]|uniref:phosphoribosylglycinamide formyltransferase n=1 Tax=Flavimarina sp. Hel_I_48 TaxID=1392488 RepID=UPI0004DF739B|nr:phosphoribosylglycinamide formyltransferase [Flavimarina sp. Hel_I_48]